MDAAEADDELMLRLQNGEDTVLNELMNRWQQPLVAFIWRYVGNEADAVDLAQETFVRIFESRHRYKRTGRFSTWMFTIAGNLCRNFVRWKSRHPTVTMDGDMRDEGLTPLSETIPSSNDSPGVAAEKRELEEAVRAGIQSLPHDLRTAILLFEYEDLSHGEIGGILGCSPKAVETRLYRARNILREKLAKWQIR